MILAQPFFFPRTQTAKPSSIISIIEIIPDKFDNASVSTEAPMQFRPARSLEQIAMAAADLGQAIAGARRTGAYTLIEIARHFEIRHYDSRIAQREVGARNKP